jgi:hypothetical protein
MSLKAGIMGLGSIRKKKCQIIELTEALGLVAINDHSQG